MTLEDIKKDLSEMGKFFIAKKSKTFSQVFEDEKRKMHSNGWGTITAVSLILSGTFGILNFNLTGAVFLIISVVSLIKGGTILTEKQGLIHDKYYTLKPQHPKAKEPKKAPNNSP